jgi:hypothetical protein
MIDVAAHRFLHEYVLNAASKVWPSAIGRQRCCATFRHVAYPSYAALRRRVMLSSFVLCTNTGLGPIVPPLGDAEPAMIMERLGQPLCGLM